MNQNNIFKYGFFALIAVIIAILMLKGDSDESKLYIDTLHEQIEVLNEKNSRLSEQNNQIAVDLDLKSDSIAVLSVDIAEIKQKRTSAIRYYEKRISNIDNLTTHELDSFFIARYGGNDTTGSDTTEVDSH